MVFTSLGDGERHREMQCEVIHIDRFSSFQWEIPCFPVMKLEFVRVLYKDGTKVLDGVIQKNVAAKTQRGKFVCKSHCCIKVKDKDYTVLWDLAPMTTRKGNPQSVCNDQSKDDDTDSEDSYDKPDESDENITHSLPFEVLGTCYSKSRQDALEDALDHLYEHNRPVFVKLVAEPENPIDKHAIAVYVMSSSNYEKVGYIARELTQFVHPHLQDPTLKVSVHSIWFCTAFLQIGFYITIIITKSGLWDKNVVKASSKVK